MKKNISFLLTFTFIFVFFFGMIITVSATVARAGLGNGDSLTLEATDVSSPKTIIQTEASTTSAPMTTKLSRKTLGIYVSSGSTSFTVRANKTYTTSWDVSGTKDTKAKWTNTSTSVGYIVIGTFTVK